MRELRQGVNALDCIAPYSMDLYQHARKRLEANVSTVRCWYEHLALGKGLAAA